MLVIRLQRVGRKNHAEFRVVVTEHTRGPKSANYLESLGHYNPHTDKVVLDAERVKEWIGKGAQVSDTVHNILVSQKIIDGTKKNVLPKKTPIVKEEEAPAEEAAPAAADADADKPAEEAAPEAAPEKEEVTA